MAPTLTSMCAGGQLSGYGLERRPHPGRIDGDVAHDLSEDDVRLVARALDQRRPPRPHPVLVEREHDLLELGPRVHRAGLRDALERHAGVVARDELEIVA